jgi:hypothetical protein
MAVGARQGRAPRGRHGGRLRAATMELTAREIYALRYAAQRQLTRWADRDFNHELRDHLAQAARTLGECPNGCELQPERGDPRRSGDLGNSR